MTQPTGTSPRAPAARASSSAMSMKEVMVPCEPLCYQPFSTSRTMNGNTEQHKLGERIAKVIARAGLASRREAEAWIAAGRVAVNGAVIASPACNVTAQDQVTIDGAPLPARERTRLFLYHKPRGLMTTHADPQGRPTIFEHLPAELPRLISVGRLDFNTEGLLLLPNDGALARVLELPATGWLRRYRVRAHGKVNQAQLDQLRSGLTLSGIHYGAIEATIERVQGANLWLTFAIREGKNREVRNVLGHLGLDVTRLIRVSFGPFPLAAQLVAKSGVDVSMPLLPQSPTQNKDPRRETTPRKPPSHSWRAHEEERAGKKFQRKFHGARRDIEPWPQRPGRASRPPAAAKATGKTSGKTRQVRPPPFARSRGRPAAQLSQRPPLM